jgi:hypothetical protein
VTSTVSVDDTPTGFDEMTRQLEHSSLKWNLEIRTKNCLVKIFLSLLRSEIQTYQLVAYQSGEATSRDSMFSKVALRRILKFGCSDSKIGRKQSSVNPIEYTVKPMSRRTFRASRTEGEEE